MVAFLVSSPPHEGLIQGYMFCIAVNRQRTRYQGCHDLCVCVLFLIVVAYIMSHWHGSCTTVALSSNFVRWDQWSRINVY